MIQNRSLIAFQMPVLTFGLGAAGAARIVWTISVRHLTQSSLPGSDVWRTPHLSQVRVSVSMASVVYDTMVSVSYKMAPSVGPAASLKKPAPPGECIGREPSARRSLAGLT
jgi:hypothetical protein